MTTEIRIRRAPIFRELYWLLCDTWAVFFRGLVNLYGWDWFQGTESQSDIGRAGLKSGFWNLEFEAIPAGGFRFWGFGQYLMICRAK